MLNRKQALGSAPTSELLFLGARQKVPLVRECMYLAAQLFHTTRINTIHLQVNSRAVVAIWVMVEPCQRQPIPVSTARLACLSSNHW